MKGSLLTSMFFIWTVLANMDRHYNLQAHLRRRTPTVDSGSDTDNELTILTPRASPLQSRNVHINCKHICTKGAKWYNSLACSDLCPKNRDKKDCDQHLRTKKTIRFLYHYFTSKKAHSILHGCRYWSVFEFGFKKCVQSFIDYHMPEVKAFKHSSDCHDPEAENTRKDKKPSKWVKQFDMGDACELNQIKSQVYGG